jgi:hypothetical protein
VPQLTPGNHTVALSGVASQCYTEPGLPLSFSVSPGELTRLTVQISCLRAYPLPFDLAFAVSAPSGITGWILIMPADGSGRHTVRLPWPGRDLRWSPDGTRLAFVASGDIYTALADGGDVRRLTAEPESDLDPVGRRMVPGSSSPDIVRGTGRYPGWRPMAPAR